MFDPTKKYTLHPRAKEKPQQDGRRDEITFRIKPNTHQRCLEGSNKTLCAPEDFSETEPDPPLRSNFECLSVSCGGMGQQSPAAGAEALGAADLGMA